jgi:hypothetical protein
MAGPRLSLLSWSAIASPVQLFYACHCLAGRKPARSIAEAFGQRQ